MAMTQAWPTSALARPVKAPIEAVADAQVKVGLVAAEEQRFKALIAQDKDEIANGMTDDAMFGHLIGQRVTKAKVLDDIAIGKPPYKSVVARDRIARVYGSVGITRGVVDMVVGERHLSDTYLAIHIRQAGRWRLLDRQSAPPPPRLGEQFIMPGMNDPGAAASPAPAAPASRCRSNTIHRKHSHVQTHFTPVQTTVAPLVHGHHADGPSDRPAWRHDRHRRP